MHSKPACNTDAAIRLLSRGTASAISVVVLSFLAFRFVLEACNIYTELLFLQLRPDMVYIYILGISRALSKFAIYGTEQVHHILDYAP